MYNLKLVVFTGLLLVSQVLSAKISYSTYNKVGGISGTGNWEQKAGGQIPDERVNELLEDIATWSNGAYTAKQNMRSGVVLVKAVEEAENKSAAVDLNNAAQQLVNEHIGQVNA